MNLITRIFIFIFGITLLVSCNGNDDESPASLTVNSIEIGTYSINLENPSLNEEAPSGENITIMFSSPVDASSIDSNITLKRKHTTALLPVDVALSNNNSVVTLTPDAQTEPEVSYIITIGTGLRGLKGEVVKQERSFEFRIAALKMSIVSLQLDETLVGNEALIENISPDQLQILITMSAPVDPSSAISANFSIDGPTAVDMQTALTQPNVIKVSTNATLKDWAKYQFKISPNVRGAMGEKIDGRIVNFFTKSGPEPDFPLITDAELLTLVQQQTFKYFWDFAHPTSGMARERNTSGDLVTSGGSGFGIMALIVGVERGFITRDQALQRMGTILTFLENAARFHGAWPHWINGTNGDVIPFSANDNGGDLVETSFLVQGLLAFRQYLSPGVPSEKTLIDRINVLWKGVEWDWYTKGGEDVLYWHWSPDKNWTMNHQIRGHNETLITYVLAASSPDHSIPASAYHNGYARGGGIKNGKQYYGVSLPLGDDFGGPLFFTHYSFLGLDPRNLTDTYANYWTQNVNHTLINQKHAINNPKNWIGYSEENWGFTASDNQSGYSAHSPTNDLGVITPTAALSSFPYTPEESMKALKFFYYNLGDRLWKEYGFVDAFNLTDEWVASSFLAIDQGPIIVMIENHRTGLIWDLFMSAPEVKVGLDKLGFTY